MWTSTMSACGSRAETLNFNLRVGNTTWDEECRSCSPVIVLLLLLHRNTLDCTLLYSTLLRYRCYEHPEKIFKNGAWSQKNRKCVTVQILMDRVWSFPPFFKKKQQKKSTLTHLLHSANFLDALWNFKGHIFELSLSTSQRVCLSFFPSFLENVSHYINNKRAKFHLCAHNNNNNN